MALAEDHTNLAHSGVTHAERSNGDPTLGHSASGRRTNILDPGFDLTLRPMRYPQFFEMYKDAIKNTWTVEEIDFSTDASSATCRLSMGGQHVLTLTVPRGGEGETPDAPAVGYTLIEGIPHSNVFTRGGRGEQKVPGGTGVVLELGDHPIADELRSLGLPDAAPLLSAWSEHMRGSFGASTKL